MMKRVILLIIVWASAIMGHLVYGQIIITAKDMPVAGDQILYSEASTQNSGFNINKTGAHQTWDFSKLTAQTQGYYNYESSLTTPYLAYYLNSIGLKTQDTLNLVLFKLSDIYDFYKKTSTRFSVIGKGFSFSGIPLPANYDVEDKIYSFPLKYKDNDSTPFHYGIKDPTGSLPFAYAQSGWRVTHVDGWGTVITPYGSFSCLRVKTKLITVDSLTISGFTVPIPRTSYEYRFLTNGEKIPVLQVNGNDVFGNFVVSQVRYRDIPRPIKPAANFDASDLQAPKGYEISFTDKSTNKPTEWLWDIQPGTITYNWGTNPGSQNPLIRFDSSGLYDVSLKVSNRAGSSTLLRSKYITIGVGGLGVSNIESSEHYKFYPNPTQKDLYIELDQAYPNFKATLFNLTGAIVYQTGSAPAQMHHLALPELASGNYILQLTTPGWTENRILIIKHDQ